MATPKVNRRRRSFKILRLFFGLVSSFFFQYLRARLTGSHYDFFQDSAHNRRRAIRIRTTALEMGGVLIKVGQFLSSRVDLLPAEYIEELALLQDEVPPVGYAEIRSVVEFDLGAPLNESFRSFDTQPLAAASLGQVHKAVLPTGEVVAVKVQRPGIESIVEADLETLRYIVSWMDKHTTLGRRANLRQVLREFEQTLHLELDYNREGHHAERLAVAFDAVPEIVIPRIYWSHSRGRVLTLQYMTGIKITDFRQLDAEGISRSVVAEILMRAYLKQVLEDGFFHADPHPGNIFIRPGPVVVLLDFGMVGDISPEMRDNIRRVFLGIIRRDFDEVLAALAKLGFIAPNADRRLLKRALVWTVDTFYELSFGELRSVDPRDVLNQLQDVLYAESFQIPANFAFLGRALGTLSGLCTALDPSFQFVTVAEPFARRLVREGTTWRNAAVEVAREARSAVRAAYSLPYLSQEVLQRVQAGEVDFHYHLGEVVHALDRLERVVRRLLYALLVTGFLVAGAFVFSKHYEAFSLVAFLIALILLVGVMSPFRRKK